MDHKIEKTLPPSPAASHQPATTVQKIILLDTHAILHRAYHAMPEFTNDAGEPTGALYGLTVMLMSLIKQFRPRAIVACYDLPQATFRHEKYEAYKAGRQKADQALIDQIVSSQEIFKAFGIPVVSSPGFEADDMLGTLVEQLAQGGKRQEAGGKRQEVRGKNKSELAAACQIIIASGDMDTLQLVEGDRVVVYTLRKGIKDTVLYNEEEVLKRYGFAPKLLVDYKGLRGDPSDNIPGVKGIGDKTATELINQFGTIEEMYVALKRQDEKSEIRNLKHETNQKSLKKKSKTNSRSSDVLVESGSKASGPGEGALLLGAGIKPRIVELLLENEEEALFSKMLATIRRDAPIHFELAANSFEEQLDLKLVEALFQKLSFRSLMSKIKDLKAGSESQAVKSALGVRQPTQRNKETGRPVVSKLAPEVGHLNPELLARVAIMSWLLDSSLTDPTIEQILARSKTSSLEAAEPKLLSLLRQDGLMRVYQEIELPLIPILTRAKARGMLIDINYLNKLAKKYHQELARLEAQIWKQVGEEFNVNSTKQLAEMLFQKLKLGEKVKGLKKTAGGAASTRVSELEKLKGVHPVIDSVMNYREYQKLLSTYIDVIPTLIDKEGRLHTTLVQTGTSTGRMASIDPNLQNIPIKTELGRAIRDGFIATPGYKLAAFDYSQIDLRTAAILSKDPLFIKIFQDKQDVHTSVASVVFRVAPEKIDYEMRRRAKVINFGILYGMGVNALRQNLGTDRKDAEEFYHTYFDRFPGLRDYLDSLKILAKQQGYTTTYFGRRRYYPQIKSPLAYIRSMEERMAMNAPIQGTSADIIKLAMSKVEEALKKAKLEQKVFPLLQVHDELIYEIADDTLSKAVPIIREVMEQVIDEPVPLEVHASVGKSWGSLEKII